MMTFVPVGRVRCLSLSVRYIDKYGDSVTCGSCWRRVLVRCMGSPCEVCGFTLGKDILARTVKMEKVTPIKVRR